MKQRLDTLLVERNLAPSRTVAQAMIMAGEVRSGEAVLLKAGQLVEAGASLRVAEKLRYVSRGGEKLASVVETLSLNFNNQVVLDVGSSTGGFTDFALQRGAIKVFAVDVGSAQLAYKLRQDSRVQVMERTDIRNVPAGWLQPRPDLAVMDVSFVSLTMVLDATTALIKPTGLIIAMAKPQFEADKPTADRFKGVIRDEAVRQGILHNFEAAVKELGIGIIASADSQLTGAQGNKERFYVLKAIR